MGLVNLRLPAVDALGLPGVSQRVLIVNENFTVVDVLFCYIFLSFSAFYGRISCIHCQMLCWLVVLLLNVPSQQLWSLRDGQLT